MTRAIGTSLSPVKLLPNNTYYWRVRAFFAGGDAGEWLGLPTTGEVVLAWDPVPGASSYELKLAPYELLGGFCNWTSPLGPTFTTATTAWTPLGTSSTGSPVGNAHPGVTVGGALQPGTTYCVRARARSDRDAKNGEIVSDWTQIGGLGHAAFTYEATSLPPCHATSMPAAAYHHEPSRTVATRAGPVRAGERVHPVSGERAAGIRLAPTWRVHVRHAAPTGPRPAGRGAPPVHVW